jgi:hypothetical protein
MGHITIKAGAASVKKSDKGAILFQKFMLLVRGLAIVAIVGGVCTCLLTERDFQHLGLGIFLIFSGCVGFQVFEITNGQLDAITRHIKERKKNIGERGQ